VGRLLRTPNHPCAGNEITRKYQAFYFILGLLMHVTPPPLLTKGGGACGLGVLQEVHKRPRAARSEEFTGGGGKIAARSAEFTGGGGKIAARSAEFTGGGGKIAARSAEFTGGGGPLEGRRPH
jgi:hypothetical protein